MVCFWVFSRLGDCCNKPVTSGISLLLLVVNVLLLICACLSAWYAHTGRVAWRNFRYCLVYAWEVGSSIYLQWRIMAWVKNIRDYKHMTSCIIPLITATEVTCLLISMED
jgi:hypothetical protein